MLSSFATVGAARTREGTIRASAGRRTDRTTTKSTTQQKETKHPRPRRRPPERPNATRSLAVDLSARLPPPYDDDGNLPWLLASLPLSYPIRCCLALNSPPSFRSLHFPSRLPSHEQEGRRVDCRRQSSSLRLGLFSARSAFAFEGSIDTAGARRRTVHAISVPSTSSQSRHVFTSNLIQGE